MCFLRCDSGAVVVWRIEFWAIMCSPLVWRLADSLIFREITYSLSNFLFFTSAASPEHLVNSDLTSYFLLADSENFKSITYSLNNSLYF